MNYKNLANELFELLGRFANLNKKEVNEFPKGELGILMFLYLKEDGISAGILSKMFKVSTARIAFALNNLERKNLIKREINSLDKRKVIVYITNEGKKIAFERKNLIIDRLTNILVDLGEKDSLEFIRLISKIINKEKI